LTTIVLRTRKLDHGAIVKMGLHAFLHRQGGLCLFGKALRATRPQEAARILGISADDARQGQIAVMKAKAAALAK
jgi:hypothetical protein